MKISIKTDPETLFLLHTILVLKRSFLPTDISGKVNQSLTLELFEVVTKRCISYTSNPNGKKISLSLKYHSAHKLYEIVINQNKTALGNFEKNKLEIFKNDLHQKLL